MHVQKNSDANDGNTDAKYNEEKTMPGFVGEICDQERKHKGGSVWCYGVELGLNWAVAVGLDDGRREI